MQPPILNNGSSLFYTGRKLRNVVLSIINPGAGIPFTRNSTVDLAVSQLIDSVEFDEDIELVEISAANALMKNYVGTKGDFSVTLTEFMNSEGFPNVLYQWKNGMYGLIEAAVEITADTAYAANGGPVSYAGSMSDGTVIQCPFICQSCRYGYSESNEPATLVGKPIGLPIYVIGPGGSLVY